MPFYQSAQLHAPRSSGENKPQISQNHICTYLLPFLQKWQVLWTLHIPFEVSQTSHVENFCQIVSSHLLSKEPVAETFIVKVWKFRQAIYQEMPTPSQMALNCPNVELEWAIISNDLQSVSCALSGVAYINVQRITFLVITCALYKVLGILLRKCACVSSLTTSWKRPRTDCFHRKKSRPEETLSQKWKAGTLWLPQSTGNVALLQLRSQRCPCCCCCCCCRWMSRQVCGNGGHDGCKVVFFLKLDQISEGKLRF